MSNKHNLDIEFKDIKNLYQPVPNSTKRDLWFGSPDYPHYTIQGVTEAGFINNIIYKAASMAGGVQYINNQPGSTSITWQCTDKGEGNEKIQQCVNRFIWLLYWLEKNDKQFKYYKGTICEERLSDFRASLRPLHDYNAESKGKRYMYFINGWTDLQRAHDNSGRLYSMTEYLRFRAMDNDWIFNDQELNKEGEYCTQLIRDYLSLTIVEKDNKVQLRHHDLYRGVSHETVWLDDIQTLSSLVEYLYRHY